MDAARTSYGLECRGPGAVGDVRDDLERDPEAGQARHRHGMGTQIEHVLGVSRVQHRHPEVGEQELRRARHRR